MLSCSSQRSVPIGSTMRPHIHVDLACRRPTLHASAARGRPARVAVDHRVLQEPSIVKLNCTFNNFITNNDWIEKKKQGNEDSDGSWRDRSTRYQGRWSIDLVTVSGANELLHA